MTLYSVANQLDRYIHDELCITTSEVADVIEDITEFVNDERIPFSLMNEAKAELTDVYEEIQSAGTELENYQVKLESLRNRLSYYCPEEPEQVALRTGSSDVMLEEWEE